MKILISGCAGFIGSRLAEALLDHGHEVRGIDNFLTGKLENYPVGEGIEPVLFGDIREAWQIPKDNWDVIYHCAASYKDRGAWERDASTNVLGTINVIREAQRTGAKLVYFQTSLCYGPSPVSPVQIDHPLDPRGSYAVSKTAGESYIMDSGVPFVSLRLANIYGPRNLSGPVPTFFQRLDQEKPCTVVNSRRDFVFVDDLIWVAVKAATQGQGVYHVSSGTDVSIAELYGAVGTAMGIEVPHAEIVPRGKDDVATLLLDPSRTFDEFGWKAQTRLSEGIPKAVAWYREHPVTETYTHLAQRG